MWNKNMFVPIFKYDMLIHQFEDKLLQKILFDEITHPQDAKIRKMPANGFYRNQEQTSTFHFGP